MTRPYELDVLSDSIVGENGFLHLRRLRLRNLRPDGTRSAEWLCDFTERRRGIDAVVLVLYRQSQSQSRGQSQGQPSDDAATIEVLLRDGLRPALIFGRPAARIPLPDARSYFLFTEVVAGIIEEGEIGEDAIKRRAVDEAWEEAGVRITENDIEMLGTSFPSPGLTAERFFFTAARLAEGQLVDAAPGDGTPMEEGSTVRFVNLHDAIRMCTSGEIEDAKTEIILRRLADRLAASASLR